jgi:hypothetical protein
MDTLHNPSDLEHTTLRELVHQAGYTVIGVRETGQGMVWTLAPHQSQVEFEVVGNDELLRFLAHS